MSSPDIVRPKPRRPFELATDTDSPSSPSTPALFGNSNGSSTSLADLPHRSKSMAALNASTLSGIYPSSLMDEPSTPFQMSRIGSLLNVQEAEFDGGAANGDAKYDAPTEYVRPAKFSVFKLTLRLLALFLSGVGYGLVVHHFHDPEKSVVSRGQLSAMIGEDPWYLFCWGGAGMTLGSLLPTLDTVLKKRGLIKRSLGYDGDGPDWNSILRSVGAFMGIAFAIRKLAWESTLQISLTLALVNPFLWFIVDRTKTGFWFASVISICGCAAVLQLAPGSIQLPNSLANISNGSSDLVLGMFTTESVALWAWISSVLFCSCVCFGNVGRLFQFRGSDVI